MNILAPSILAADFSMIGNEISSVTEAGVKWIHLDVMDGEFVPNISFGIPVISSVRKCTDAFLDTHLMIREPIRYIKEFAEIGVDMITIHFEACDDVNETIDTIHSYGVKAGLAVSPDTDVEVVRPYISKVEMILVMSVYPGFGGQKFIVATLERLQKVRCMMKESGQEEMLLEVDGGVTKDNVRTICDAGANVIVAGSAVFKGDKAANVKTFTELLS